MFGTWLIVPIVASAGLVLAIGGSPLPLGGYDVAGPGAGGGYDPDSDGPGSGGGYDLAGPGLGGGYDPDSDGPGSGGGYDLASAAATDPSLPRA